MRLREGWYFASLGGASVECVKVRRTAAWDQDRSCEWSVESVGYASPMPADRFEFYERISLPPTVRTTARTKARERADRILGSLLDAGEAADFPNGLRKA